MQLPPKRSIERKLVLFFLVNVLIISFNGFIILLSIVLNCGVINIIPIIISVLHVPSIIIFNDVYFKKSYFKILLQYFKDDPIENVIPTIKKGNNNDIFGNTVFEEIRIDEMENVFITDSGDVTYIVVPAGFYTNIIKNYNSYYIDSYRTIIMLKDSDKINKSTSHCYRRVSINVTDEKLLAKIKLMEK